MRGKHHYTIKKIDYDYEGEWLSFEGQTKRERVIFTTNKRDKAEGFYHGHLYLENGTEYKGIYYPNCELVFIRDY